jgi:hypothetical protein
VTGAFGVSGSDNVSGARTMQGARAKAEIVATGDPKAALAAYGTLPLSFVPNAGQLDRRVRYSAQAAGNGSQAEFIGTPVDVLVSIRQTIALHASKAAGSIARGTRASFTAVVRPLGGGPATVRFEVYHRVSGVRRLASRRK